jgi:hypothetical protein
MVKAKRTTRELRFVHLSGSRSRVGDKSPYHSLWLEKAKQKRKVAIAAFANSLWIAAPKRRTLLTMKWLSWLFLLALATASPAFTQETRDKLLKISLRSESSSRSMRGDLRLEIVRENVSTHDLIVPRWWGWGGGRTNIWVYDDKGKEVVTTFLADELPPPPQAWDFIMLDVGQFVGTHVTEPVQHFVNKPGVYELVVEYTSYLSEQYAREVMKMPDAPFWSRERGSLLSNRVKVTVTK